MKQTIDQKVLNVIKKENRKHSEDPNSFFQIVNELELIIGSTSENYTIAPKDTIGKDAFYNIVRT